MWTADEIVAYWFGPPTDDQIPDADIRRRWFQGGKPFDREIRRRFMSSIVLAAEGGFDYWLPAPAGYLAIVLILDQFSRHAYRNTSIAYDYDRQARKVCREGLDAAVDVKLTPIQRAFFYMPLKHSERLPDQKDSVTLHKQLLANCQDREADIIAGFVQVAEEHLETIKRFGRFPQRNKILKRGSRSEEIDFLDQKSNTFRA